MNLKEYMLLYTGHLLIISTVLFVIDCLMGFESAVLVGLIAVIADIRTNEAIRGMKE